MANKCIDKGVSLTTVKLQKLLIIAHGALLSAYGRPLFYEEVILMKHGVGIKEVDRAFRYEIKYDEKFEEYISLLDCQHVAMDAVIERYGKSDSFELSSLKSMKRVERFLKDGDFGTAITNGAIASAFEDNIVTWKLKYLKELDR